MTLSTSRSVPQLDIQPPYGMIRTCDADRASVLREDVDAPGIRVVCAERAEWQSVVRSAPAEVVTNDEYCLTG